MTHVLGLERGCFGSVYGLWLSSGGFSRELVHAVYTVEQSAALRWLQRRGGPGIGSNRGSRSAIPLDWPDASPFSKVMVTAVSRKFAATFGSSSPQAAGWSFPLEDRPDGRFSFGHARRWKRRDEERPLLPVAFVPSPL